MPGSEDPYVDTVDEIEAALREDPVLVQDAMGNGHSAEIDAHLSQLVTDAGFPVYVVLGVTPRDLLGTSPDQELVHVLHGRLGEGLYIVGTATQSGVQAEYYGPPLVSFDSGSNALSNLAHDAFRQVEDALPPDHELADATFAALAVELLDEDIERLDDSHHADDHYIAAEPLTDAQVATYSSATWSYPDSERATDLDDPPEAGFVVVAGVAVALTVAVVGYRLLQAATALWGARGVTGSRPAAATVRKQAAKALAALAERLGQAPGDSAAELDAREVARGCADAAHPLLGSGLLDQVAALVLARTGHHALDHPGAPAYRCCFLDPLHGEGTERAGLGGRESVPVCASCAATLAGKRRPVPLIEQRRGVDRPYYEGDSRWAETGFGSLDPDRFRHTAAGAR